MIDRTVVLGLVGCLVFAALVRWLWRGAKREEFADDDAIDLARRQAARDRDTIESRRRMLHGITRGGTNGYGGPPPAA